MRLMMHIYGSAETHILIRGPRYNDKAVLPYPFLQQLYRLIERRYLDFRHSPDTAMTNDTCAVPRYSKYQHLKS